MKKDYIKSVSPKQLWCKKWLIRKLINTNIEFKNIHFQASGGISSLNDLKNLTTDGVVIGKSLYDERFTLKEAIKVSKC